MKRKGRVVCEVEARCGARGKGKERGDDCWMDVYM